VSLTLLMVVIVALVASARLADIYSGGHYVCPSCGARDQDRHSSQCPWKPR
jgi:hypothetical protein